MRKFRTLEIWKNGIENFNEIYVLSENLPSEEKFRLKSQITRAAVSIPSHIAEGCSRPSGIEFKCFFGNLNGFPY